MTIDPEHGIGRISADAVTVPVETTVFDDRPDARFFIGIVATPSEVIMPEEYNAWLKLRGNVYVDEMQFLPPEVLDEQGREVNSDDDRSTQFAVIQNVGAAAMPRVIGGARLIMKRDETDDLPVEKLFPEAFQDHSAPLGSAEASRVISRNDHKLVRGAVAMAVIRALTMHTHDRGNKPVYVVIEEYLEKVLQKTQSPYNAIADYKHLEEYRTDNMAAAIDPADMLAAVRPENHVRAPLMTAFYTGAEVHKGLGHFDDTLVRSL